MISRMLPATLEFVNGPDFDGLLRVLSTLEMTFSGDVL